MANLTLEQESIVARMRAAIKAEHERRAPKPWEPATSFTVAELAPILGLSESMTRSRMKKMEESKLVTEWTVRRRNGRGNVDVAGWTLCEESARANALMQLDRDETALYGTTIEELRENTRADAKRLCGMIFQLVNDESWLVNVSPHQLSELRKEMETARERINAEVEIANEEMAEATKEDA